MNDEERQKQVEHAMVIKQMYEHTLLAKRHVVGVGVGLRQLQGEYTDSIALVVMVDTKLPEDDLDPEDVIPPELEGVPVDVQEVGEVKAL